MRFAVALLSILGIASVIGTVIQQSRPPQDYVAQFGPFWVKIFDFLGLFDVYASWWFVVIMLFLVLSTGLCLWRNIPPFVREMRSFRLKTTEKSLSLMAHSHVFPHTLSPQIAEQYLQAQGFQTRRDEREDAVLIAAKKGSLNKLGYICAHVALIVICLGGLIDSNLLLKIGMLSGRIVPDHTAQYASDFPPQSRLGAGNLSFRGDITLPEGQSTDAVFLSTGNNGFLVQELPFTVKLNRFHVDYYDTGMPKNFASDITVTDKHSGQSTDTTIRVNHPLKMNGVTIYQASFGDGGSPLEFDIWHLNDPAPQAQQLKVRSLSTVPLQLGSDEYQLSFTDFKATNVENIAEAEAGSFGTALKDVRSVRSSDTMQNIGASIRYDIRDQAGQAYQYMNYLLPQVRDNAAYYFYGVKKPDEPQFRWLGIPLDQDGGTQSFMLLRQAFNNPDMIAAVAEKTAVGVAPDYHDRAVKLADDVMRLFRQGGYEAIDTFIRTAIPAGEQEEMARLFYQIIASSTNQMLTEVLANNGLPAWEASEGRTRFVLDSLQAMTGLHHYPAPVLLQLRHYEEVNASGLQMTRSPGESLVYLGSLLLTLGAIFMFYLREKRAWVMIGNEHTRFAMSANRHRRDLDKEFPRHIGNLEQLIKDIPHESKP
ncbi:MAG: cytochrome c biogenesis protein ResB [Neisseria sp.]|nr:cytochrome c biogenesis protein ResB [Neisseria sp.]